MRLEDSRVNGDIDQLNEINQPGSSFKPAVYLTWMDILGRHPMSTFWDTSPLPIEGTSVSIVNPRGDGKTGEGLITAYSGMGGSQNVPAFRAALEAGVDNVIEMAQEPRHHDTRPEFRPDFPRPRRGDLWPVDCDWRSQHPRDRYGLHGGDAREHGHHGRCPALRHLRRPGHVQVHRLRHRRRLRHCRSTRP